MTSTPRRCRAMSTSLPSSPAPSSMTRVADGESGVPIDEPEVEADMSAGGGWRGSDGTGRRVGAPAGRRFRTGTPREGRAGPLSSGHRTMSLALAAPAGSTRPLSGTTHMLPHGHDVAQTRLDNALALFDEFVQATVSHPDAAALRGLERRFAEKVLIQPSYWSQIKRRSRQIGERLARQFEQCCHKPRGWMDEPHTAGTPPSSASPWTAGPCRT